MGSVSCFNVTMTYRNKCEPQPTNTYFDVISENRDHTSYAQKSHLKKVFEHTRFKEIALTKKYVEFHFDNASHFISEEFAFFILRTFLNFFLIFDCFVLPICNQTRKKCQ